MPHHGVNAIQKIKDETITYCYKHSLLDASVKGLAKAESLFTMVGERCQVLIHIPPQACCNATVEQQLMEVVALR